MNRSASEFAFRLFMFFTFLSILDDVVLFKSLIMYLYWLVCNSFSFKFIFIYILLYQIYTLCLFLYTFVYIWLLLLFFLFSFFKLNELFVYSFVIEKHIKLLR